eukprot:TRINITY_DN104648_c0_g1_i1.p1 TRINITY_DN104648_c0_g1~~TRINITY_DN104648_c0_g1_i1.p1  ORF type:complete len:497 (-),score=58.03 TRINITY_DN104648_c0_g1_i1:154-1644(-)
MALAAFFFAQLYFPLAEAIITPTAQCTCLKNGLARDGNGMVTADGFNGTPKLGGTYGDSCGQQTETFHQSCVNSSGHPLANAASWCASPWCWVDPCTCKLPDVARSSYFTANIYYSYSNCGGSDTYTTSQQSVASCPVYNTTPGSACQPRMSNDYPLIDCKDSFAIMGKCRNASISGTMTNYPPSYGEGCGVHLEPGQSACSNADGTPKDPGNQSAWCKQPFSWVNPCECSASDLAKSTYFPGLYYSYSVCGGTDSYTTAAFNNTITTEAVCPSPPPPAATIQSPGNFPGSDPVNKKCACQPFPASIPLADCTTSYAQNGKCVNATKFPGYYPANYGTSCGIHMEPLTSSCFDLATGTPWKSPCRGDKTSGCRASWCDSAWCWVDPCTCNSVTDIAQSSWFVGQNIFYSYSNCNGVDSFTSSAEATGETPGITLCKPNFQTCGDVANAYGAANCCGQPEKMMGATGQKCIDVRKAYQASNCCTNQSAPFVGNLSAS